MKIELQKINERDGTFWYGIMIDGNCQIPGYGTDLKLAQEAYDRIVAHNKATPYVRYETISETEIPTP